MARRKRKFKFGSLGKDAEQTVLLSLVLLLMGVVLASVFLGGGPDVISGAATGTTNVSILSRLSIDFVSNQDNIDFGDGYVLDACTSATLATDDAAINTTCWSNSTYIYNTTTNVFEIVNDGSVNATVTISGGTAATFIGGTNPSYEWRGANSETGSCLSGNFSYLDMSTTAQVLCNNLGRKQANDQMYTHIRIKIPEDASTGEHGDTVTFTASGAIT